MTAREGNETDSLKEERKKEGKGIESKEKVRDGSEKEQ